MFREPLNAVKARVELGAGRMAAQVAAGIAAAFALVFAVPATVLWLLDTDSARVALAAVAATFFLLAIGAMIAVAVMGARQRRLKRETNVLGSLTGVLAATLAARPSRPGRSAPSRMLRLVRRAPLLSLGGAALAGLLVISMGPRSDNRA
jgi:hypothetical protein